MKTREQTDLTRFQQESIRKWDYDIEQIRQIKAKTDEHQAVLDKFAAGSIDVHRTNGRRIFNPFTSMKRAHRQYVSYMGEKLIEVDAKNSHPLIMVHKMKQEGHKIEKDVEIAVMSGTFYDYLTEPGLTRDQVKESWFSFCYNKEVVVDHKVYKRLAAVFPDFLQSFINYAKDRSLSEYLQELESRVWIDKVSTALMRANIPHTTIHDSVVFHGVQYLNKVLDIVEAAFSPITPPLHVNYLDDTPVQYTRVQNPDNAKYLKPDWQLVEELQDCKVDPFADYTKPETAVTMIDGENEFPLFTIGNFSAVSGKSKSGKTLLTSAIIASALSANVTLGKFKGCLPIHKCNILYMDTEMADYDLGLVMKRILKMAGVKKGDDINIHFYKLREKNTKKRVELIDTAIRTIKNLGLVVIDGIRDIVNDINNPEESTIAINNIMRWTDVYNIHLIAILHQNPGTGTGNKLRGHIGTEAMNKAEAVISIVKEGDNEHGTVKPDFMRREQFKQFGIGYDIDNHIPVIVDVIDKPIAKRHKAQDVKKDDYKAIVEKLFNGREKWGKTLMCEKVKEILLLKGYNIGRNESVKCVEYMENIGLISIEKEGVKYSCYQS